MPWYGRPQARLRRSVRGPGRRLAGSLTEAEGRAPRPRVVPARRVRLTRRDRAGPPAGLREPSRWGARRTSARGCLRPGGMVAAARWAQDGDAPRGPRVPREGRHVRATRLVAAILAAGAVAGARAQSGGAVDVVAEEVAPTEVVHQSTVAAVADGLLLTWSGYSTSGRTSALEIFDPAAGAWSRDADLPSPRNSGCGFVLGGSAYHVGGEGPSSARFSRDVWRYDPAAQAWEARASYPVDLWGASAAVVDGRAFVLGGRPGYTASSPAVFEYDAAADAWIPRADLPDSVLVPGVLAHGGLLHVYGGQHRASESDITYRRNLQVYDPVLDEWAFRPDVMPWQLRSVQVVPGCGDQALLFASSRWDEGQAAFVPNDLVFAHGLADDTWSTWGRLVLPGAGLPDLSVDVVKIGAHAYFVGTRDDDTWTSRVFRVTVEPTGPPDDVGATLRVRSDPQDPRGTVHLDWSGAPARRPWERYRVLRGSRAQLPAQPLPPHGADLEETGSADAAAAGPLWFYEIRTVDCHDEVSADPWPPSVP